MSYKSIIIAQNVQFSQKFFDEIIFSLIYSSDFFKIEYDKINFNNSN